MTNEEAEQIIDRHALQLRQMGFENVQILASWMEGCVTKGCVRGAGDWYARKGLAQEFINHDIAIDTAQQIGRELDKPDDGEAWKQAT